MAIKHKTVGLKLTRAEYEASDSHTGGYTDAEVAADIATHAALATGIHGVGASTVAKVADIAATKIDDLTAGDDNTDLDGSSTKHGLYPKADASKLVGIEAGSTKYPDTGEQAFLDADHTKLDGIAAGATAYTDALAKAASVQSGAITDGVTLAPTHDAVYDGLLTKIPKSLLTEQGDVIYASGVATPTALAHGTSAQYLKSGGHGANPSWDTPTGGVKESIADHIIYKDAAGIHALRTEDGVITHTHATDGGAVINAPLASLTLAYSPSYPDQYVRGSNLNGWKQGRRVKIMCQEFTGSTTSAIVIPPSQNFIFDAGLTQFTFGGTGNFITIDSCMNCHFIFGVVWAYSENVTNLIRIYPHTVGPDDMIVATTSKFIIETVGGKGNGVVLDATAAPIEHLRIDISEVNCSVSPKGDGVYIPAPAVYTVQGCEVTIDRVWDCTNAFNIASTTLVKDNVFQLDHAVVSRPIVDGSGKRNTFIVYPPPGARVYHNANQAIANETPVTLDFNSERYDTDIIHDTVTNNSRLTCKTPGKYLINAQVEWVGASATGRRIAYIYLNGTTPIAQITYDPTAAVNVRYAVTTVYDLAVNDYVTVVVYQTSGGNLDVVSGANFSPEFMMQKVG